MKKWLNHDLFDSSRMISQASVLASAQYFSALIGLFTTAVAARWLGPSEYGMTAIAISLPTLIFTLADVKSTSVTTRYVAMFHGRGERDRLAALCKLGFLIDTVIAFIVLFLVYVISISLPGHSAIYISQLSLGYALCYPFAALASTSQATVTGLKRFGTLAGLQITDKLIQLALICVFLGYLGRSAAPMVYAMGLSQACVGLINLFIASSLLLRQNVPKWWSIPVIKAGSVRRELASALGWNFVVVSCSGAAMQVPLLALGVLRGTEAAGFFRLAWTIATVASYVEASFGRVAYTRLVTDLHSTNARDLSQILRGWTWKGLGLASLQLTAVLFLPFFVRVAFGGSYEPMVLGASTLLLANVVSGSFFWLSSFFYAFGRVSTWAKGQIVYAGSVIGFGVYAGSKWGFTGMAVVSCAMRVVLTLMMVAVAARILRNRGADVETNAVMLHKR